VACVGRLIPYTPLLGTEADAAGMIDAPATQMIRWWKSCVLAVVIIAQ
jgi:hypothetical protein